MDVTLLELHFPGAQFNAPFSGRTDRSSQAGSGADGADDEPGEPSGLGALVALGILGGLALLAWYLSRGLTDGEPASPDDGADG